MADYCQQCSLDLFGKDLKELAALLPREDFLPDNGAEVLCEGCGWTLVDFDGKCVDPKCKVHSEPMDLNQRLDKMHGH